MPHDARHRGDHDHRRRQAPAAVPAGLEEGQERHGREVDGRDVGAEGVGPLGEGLAEQLPLELARVRAVGLALGPRDPGVRDEEVDVRLPLPDLVDEVLEVVFAGHVARPDAGGG